MKKKKFMVFIIILIFGFLTVRGENFSTDCKYFFDGNLKRFVEFLSKDGFGGIFTTGKSTAGYNELDYLYYSIGAHCCRLEEEFYTGKDELCNKVNQVVKGKKLLPYHKYLYDYFYDALNFKYNLLSKDIPEDLKAIFNLTIDKDWDYILKNLSDKDTFLSNRKSNYISGVNYIFVTDTPRDIYYKIQRLLNSYKGKQMSGVERYFAKYSTVCEQALYLYFGVLGYNGGDKVYSLDSWYNLIPWFISCKQRQNQKIQIKKIMINYLDNEKKIKNMGLIFEKEKKNTYNLSGKLRQLLANLLAVIQAVFKKVDKITPHTY